MKLLEYDANLFLKKNKYKNDQKKKCIMRRFMLGAATFFKTDWLGSNDKYTPVDFINEVYELNLTLHEMDENELIESLARFLCGYDEAINLIKSNEFQNKNEYEQHNYFQNKRDNIDNNISDERIEEKIKIIKGVLNSF